jgi:hypothetical protein
MKRGLQWNTLIPSTGCTSCGNLQRLIYCTQVYSAFPGEYVTQVTAVGPFGLEYVSAKDDPRNNNS